MRVQINYCNNIDHGEFEIIENHLNIFYAINGTGKSTLSQALNNFSLDNINNSQTLKQLKPFKYYEDDEKIPQVSGLPTHSTVRVFNENYVNEFVYLPSNELLKGSYEIFICDEEYNKRMEEINNLVSDLRKGITEDSEINQLILDLNSLSDAFGSPVKTGIHKSSQMAKAFKSGNILVNIPEDLTDYSEFIRNENNLRWVKWQKDGKSYLDISDKCPFCTNNVEKQKEKIIRLSNEYDSRIIESLTFLLDIFSRLEQYFSEETKIQIDKLKNSISGLNEEQTQYLINIKKEIELFRNKFINAQSIGFNSLKDVDKVIEVVSSLKIDLPFFVHLQSEACKEIVRKFNNSLDNLSSKAGKLQGEVNRQKTHIEKLIKDNKKMIDSFLKNAGYQYHVELLLQENGKHKLVLVHNDLSEEVNNVKGHLSYGERNAFALVLFMYDVLKNSPDIIILDDPVSSFDKNKKFAILDFLFRQSGSLREKTVLMLTHDLDPIVDMVYHHSDRFCNLRAAFLENRFGTLHEFEIKKSDIKTYLDICHENIENGSNTLIKLIYLRRLLEIEKNKGSGFDIISNIFHKRGIPTKFNPDYEINQDSLRTINMEENEIEAGISEIISYIPDFNYASVMTEVLDANTLKVKYINTINNYEKLQIFRIYYEDKFTAHSEEEMKIDPVFKKFINEAFHIENDNIYQLNPNKYQVIPNYIIEKCDYYMNLS